MDIHIPFASFYALMIGTLSLAEETTAYIILVLLVRNYRSFVPAGGPSVFYFFLFVAVVYLCGVSRLIRFITNAAGCSAIKLIFVPINWFCFSFLWFFSL